MNLIYKVMDPNSFLVTRIMSRIICILLVFLLTSISVITIILYFKREIISMIMNRKIISQKTGHAAMKNKNNSFNNTFVVTGHHKISRINKLFEQI